MSTAICNKNMDDREVIQNYLKTQANPCFELLYQRYGAKVYAKCLSMLKDEAQAQDATQEIFLKIFTNLSKFKQQSKFSTWVYSITYNYCIDFLRRKKKVGDIFSDEMEQTPDVPDDEISDKVLLEIEIQKLKEILDNIPVGDKAVLLMKYQDDMSIKEIAEVLDKTESAVKMKIKRAKDKALQVRQDLFNEN